MWNKHHAKIVVAAARAHWGAGWAMLSPDEKVNAIKAEVTTVLLMQDTSAAFTSGQIEELFVLACTRANLQ